MPAHFPRDDWALAYFDGTELYEHEDPRRATAPIGARFIFNYGRHEVRNFLIGNALFWWSDITSTACAWTRSRRCSISITPASTVSGFPTTTAGAKTWRRLIFSGSSTTVVHTEYPGVMTDRRGIHGLAQVTRPPYVGGFGFALKWNMGWMHDTLEYFTQRPRASQISPQRSHVRDALPAYHENFVLPLSHDEVVHGKGSLFGRMPGDDWQKFANLRALLRLSVVVPGKKLLFMGGEIGQRRSGTRTRASTGTCCDHHRTAACRQLGPEPERLYRNEPALRERDCENARVRVDRLQRRADERPHLPAQGAVAGGRGPRCLQLGPMPRPGYRVGVPTGGRWRELLNSDATEYGGAGWGNMGGLDAEPLSHHGRPLSLPLTLPPLGAVFLKPEGAEP